MSPPTAASARTAAKFMTPAQDPADTIKPVPPEPARAPRFSATLPHREALEMSIKSKLVTAATALTVMAGVGAAGTLTANAATSKCGAICSEFYSATTGTAFVLDAPKQARQPAQPLTLPHANRASKAEDFVVQTLGTVSDFPEAGSVSA